MGQRPSLSTYAKRPKSALLVLLISNCIALNKSNASAVVFYKQSPKQFGDTVLGCSDVCVEAPMWVASTRVHGIGRYSPKPNAKWQFG